MAELRCPVCHKPNPTDLEFCQFCDAPLLPRQDEEAGEPRHIRAGEEPVRKQTSEFERVKPGSETPIRPGDKPTRKDTGELERALPSWLKNLRGVGEQTGSQPPFDEPPELALPGRSKPAPSEEGGGDSLDWLNGLESVSQEEADGEFPEWMAGLRNAASGGLDKEETAAPARQEDSDSPPAWFAADDMALGETQPARRVSFEPPGEEQGGEAGTEGTPRAESTPDWLEEIKARAVGSVQEPASGGKGNLPDWLSNLPAIPVEASSAEPVSEPDWLESLKEKAIPVDGGESPFASEPGRDMPAQGGKTGPPVFIGGDVPVPEMGSQVPDWLAQLQSDANRASSEEKHSEEFEAAESPLPFEASKEPVPDWLASLEPGGTSAGGIPALVIPEGGESSAEPPGAAFSLETPDWLTRLRPERKAEAAAPAEEEPASESLEAAELPSWVQAMRPLEAVVADAAPPLQDETSPVESSGPLAGLRGVLPGGAGLLPGRKPAAHAVKLKVSTTQQRYAALLEKMVMEEGQPKSRASTQLNSGLIWRMVISLALLAAVLFPLLAGRQVSPDMVLFPSEWEATSHLLNQFGSDTSMLLVFDYDPALSGELEAAAAPVVDHLLFLGTRLALISSAPTGPALAEQFLEDTQAYHLQTGTQYTNLGYLAGGPAGIQLFAADPLAAAPVDIHGAPAWGSPALQRISRLGDFAALVILTDNADTGRIWIEQTRLTLGDTPILMIISAQVEPMIRPYYDSGQIQGLVTGLMGGKAYEQTYATPGLARLYWDSFGTGTLAAVILITVGASLNALPLWRRLRKG